MTVYFDFYNGVWTSIMYVDVLPPPPPPPPTTYYCDGRYTHISRKGAITYDKDLYVE